LTEEICYTVIIILGYYSCSQTEVWNQQAVTQDSTDTIERKAV